jgi:Tol biopolymer transport system component
VDTVDGLLVGGAAAFPISRDSGGEICVVGADGKGARRLTNTGHLAEAPAWSPDGKRIVFARGIVHPAASVPFGGAQLQALTAGKIHGLFTADAMGGPMRRLTRLGGDDLPSWSPDGGTIAFTTAAGRIALVDSSGSGRRMLTAPTNAVDVGASWSPDGHSIAFTRVPMGQYKNGNNVYTGPARYETWVMHGDGSGQRQLTSSRSFNDTNALAFRPRWSPGGRQIALTTVREEGNSYWFQVTVVSLQGGHQRQLGFSNTDPEQIGSLLPTWSPDGTKISFLSDISGDCDVYTTAARGGVRRPLTRDAVQQYDPAWAPQ